MNKTSNAKYYVIMGVFALLFLFVFAVVTAFLKSNSGINEWDKISYRLDSIQTDIEFGGCVSRRLRFDNDIEEDFNAYWEFSSVETAYIEGILFARAMYDSDGEDRDYYEQCLQERIDKINDYLVYVEIPWMEEFAKEYVETLEGAM